MSESAGAAAGIMRAAACRAAVSVSFELVLTPPFSRAVYVCSAHLSFSHDAKAGIPRRLPFLPSLGHLPLHPLQPPLQRPISFWRWQRRYQTVQCHTAVSRMRSRATFAPSTVTMTHEFQIDEDYLDN